MGAYVEKDAEHIHTGLPINAVRQNGRVEIWDEEWEYHYGSLKGDASMDEIKTAYLMWERGFQEGKAQGRRDLQHELRAKLGIA